MSIDRRTTPYQFQIPIAFSVLLHVNSASFFLPYAHNFLSLCHRKLVRGTTWDRIKWALSGAAHCPTSSSSGAPPPRPPLPSGHPWPSSVKVELRVLWAALPRMAQLCLGRHVSKFVGERFADLVAAACGLRQTRCWPTGVRWDVAQPTKLCPSFVSANGLQLLFCFTNLTCNRVQHTTAKSVFYNLQSATWNMKNLHSVEQSIEKGQEERLFLSFWIFQNVGDFCMNPIHQNSKSTSWWNNFSFKQSLFRMTVDVGFLNISERFSWF